MAGCVRHGRQNTHRVHEERAAAYSMYFLESNDLQKTTAKILIFAVGADGKQPTSNGDETDE